MGIWRVHSDQFGWWAYVVDSLVFVYPPRIHRASGCCRSPAHFSQNSAMNAQNARRIVCPVCFVLHVIIEYWIRNNAFSPDVCPEMPNGMRHRQFRLLRTLYTCELVPSVKKRNDGEWAMGARHKSESNGVSVYLSVPNANANARRASCIESKTREKSCYAHTIGACLFLYLSF